MIIYCTCFLGHNADTDDENLQTILNLDFTKEDVCLSESMMNSVEGYHTQVRIQCPFSFVRIMSEYVTAT